VNANTLTSFLESLNSIVEYVVKRLKMSDVDEFHERSWEGTNVYNIKHCIWCGKRGFKDSQEVIEHIKSTHTRAV
jgi:hypothetical protein